MTFHSPTDLENARKSDKANSKQKYVYLNIWINTHMRVCVCGCAWADVCACVRSCTCMHARVCVHVHVGMRVCVPAFLSSYMWQRMELVYVYVQRINSYIYSFCRRTNPEVTLPNSRRLKDTIVPGARRGSMTPACHALDRPGRWHRPAPSAMGHAPLQFSATTLPVPAAQTFRGEFEGWRNHSCGRPVGSQICIHVCLFVFMSVRVLTEWMESHIENTKTWLSQ